MRRLAALAMVLLVVLVAAQSPRTEQRQVAKEPASSPDCATAILEDWYLDDRIDGRYPARCYEALRKSLHLRVDDYGAGSLIDVVYARR
jgi:hypothetical protein